MLQATYSRHLAGAPAREEGATRVGQRQKLSLRTRIKRKKAKEGQGYPYLRREIRRLWKNRRGDIIIKPTALFLESQFQLLARLRSTDPDALRYLANEESSLRRKYQRLDEAERQAALKPKPKPRLTGGYIWPSPFNPPLPRLKPQPAHISGMFRNRVIDKEKRVQRFRKFQEWERDMRFEQEFRTKLGVDPRPAIMHQIREFYGYFNEAFERESARARMVFTEETCVKVERARKAKFRGVQRMWERRRRRAERERQASERAESPETSSEGD